MIIIKAKKRTPIVWSMVDNKPIPKMSVDSVITVQADEEELDVILTRFHNLPHTNAAHQVWTGEFARYLFANLPNIFDKAYSKKKDVSSGPMEE